MRSLPIVIAFVSLSAFAEISDDPSKWQYETEVDDFTDEHRAVALVVSETGFEGGFIMLQCHGDNFEAKVGAGQYIGDKRIHDNVMYRVDKNEPVKMTMNPTRKSYVYFNDPESRFVADLINGADTVIVQLTSYDFDRSKARFTLDGSTDAIRKILETCGD